MDESDGRGVRNFADDFGAYIPNPTTLSGFAGNSMLVESLEVTKMCDDSEVDDRYLNDISEYI